MAKNKGRRSTGGETNTPNGGVSVKESAPVEVSFPNLDETALANLTQKIEQRLKDGNGATKKDQKKPKNTTANGGKKDKKNEQKASEKPDSNKGKKRDRNGDVISREVKDAGKKNEQEDENDALRQEILALGGSKEDYDLIAGVDSESEVEGQNNASVKPKGGNDEDALRKELSKMLQGAGHIVPKDIEQEEDDDDDDQDEEDFQDEDGEEDIEGSNEDQEISDVEEDVPEDVSPPPASKSEKEASKKKSAAKTPARNEMEVLPKAYSRLTVPPRSDWYSTSLPLVSTSAKNVTALPRHLIDRIHQHAKSLLEKENKLYAEAQQSLSSSSHKFYSTIVTSGTLSDKISALTLAVQESPLHNTKALENLIGLGKKRSRAQAVEVLRSLKDMFSQGTLLPSDRRLKTFANQPSLVAAFQGAASRWTERDPLPGGLQAIHLIAWAYEDYLKEQYFEVLKILEVWCNDEIEFSRSRAVSYVYELLREKPEQESNLLRLLVNKLGDPSKKIASRASYLLLQLEQAHPLMKSTIISSIESELLFRPHQSQHARYYAVITLNQTVLSTKEEKVALQLLDIYFSLFVTLLKPEEKKVQTNQKRGKFGKGGKKPQLKNAKAKGQDPEDELREKIISAVLAGVNRAYPFSQSDSERITKHIDTLFRITHSSNFNTSIQALMLIQQITYSNQISGDRFYRTLYESLLDPRVATSSKQSLYLNLLFKALKNDLNVKRVKAFVKRLVQTLGLHQPSFVVGVFYLIRELEKTFSGLQSLVDQPEENDDDEEEVFRDVPDEDDQEPKETAPVTDENSKKQANGYDPRKRDPEHSNADKSCLWELLPYISHFHPSVSVNASHLLSHMPMSGKPDMTLHTLTHFLDRFVYRTPKANAGARGSSIMQPLAGGDTSGLLVTVGGVAGKGKQLEPVNSESFWRKKAEDVAAEDVFFHEYFNRVGKDKARKEKKGAKGPVSRDEEADVDVSDNESDIWKAMLDSKPDLEGIDDDDDDADLDMSDLEEFDYDDDEDMNEDGDEEVIFNDESDEAEEEEEEKEEDVDEQEAKPTKAKKKAAEKQPSDDEDDEDAFDMDISDDEAFRDSDEDLPSDMEIGGVELPAEPEDKDKSGRKKRRKLKHLPTFASLDDYAALLANEKDGM